MIPAAVRIFVCTEFIDMRQGFDRLAQVVKGKLGEDPQAGSIFVFANRNATRLKALWFDGNGYCLLYNRLHRAVFELPPSGVARRCSSIRVNWQSCCEAARARRGGKMFEMRSSRLDS